jgi:hypothetical protein
MTKDTLPFSQVIFRDRFLYLLIFILMLIAIQPLDEAPIFIFAHLYLDADCDPAS